jgi:hypothetical protein
MELRTENKILKQRVKRLESALQAMLDVAWPNPDLPNSRTNHAINKARRVLKNTARSRTRIRNHDESPARHRP